MRLGFLTCNRPLSFLLAGGLFLLPGSSDALEDVKLYLGVHAGISRVMASGEADSEPDDGPVLGTQASLMLSPSLGISTTLTWAGHGPEFTSPAHSLVQEAIGLVYQVDTTFSWRPELSLELVADQGSLPGDAPWGPLSLRLGLALLLSRWAPWEVGLDLRYEAFFSEWESYPHTMMLIVRVERLIARW